MSFGAIGGAVLGGVASTVVGGLMGGGGGGGGQAQAQSGNSNHANTTSNTTVSNLDVASQGLQETQGSTSNEGNLTGTQQGTQGFNDFSGQAGMFNTNFQNGNLNVGMNAQGQGMNQQFGQQFNQFGNQALMGGDANAQMGSQQAGGFLGSLQSDPFAAQQQLFQQQLGMITGDQEQARLDQEGRLFSQGRLGSTEGGNDTNQLLDAQAQERLGLMNNSFGQAQQMNVNNAGIGQNLAGMPLGQQQALMGMSGQGAQGMFNLNNQGMNLANTAGQFAGQNTSQNTNQNTFDTGNMFQQQNSDTISNQRGTNQSNGFDRGTASQTGNLTGTINNPSMGAQVGNGLINAGAGVIGNAVGGLFNPVGGGNSIVPSFTNTTQNTFAGGR